MTNVVQIIKHYDKLDTMFTGDYVRIEIFFNGEKLEEYGDAYHDKGEDKVEGFLDCLKIFCEGLEVDVLRIADENVY